MREPVALITAVVVGLVGVRNDQMGLSCDLDPIGEFVIERITVIEKATSLYQQTSCVGSRPPSHPAYGAHACETLDGCHSLAYMLAFHLFVYVMIVDPAIAVADDLVATFDKSAGHCRVPLEGRGHAEHAQRNVELGEDAQYTPDP